MWWQRRGGHLVAAGWKLKCIIIKMAKLLIPAKCLKIFVDGCEPDISSPSIPALNAHMPVLLKHLQMLRAPAAQNKSYRWHLGFLLCPFID